MFCLKTAPQLQINVVFLLNADFNLYLQYVYNFKFLLLHHLIEYINHIKNCFRLYFDFILKDSHVRSLLMCKVTTSALNMNKMKKVSITVHLIQVILSLSRGTSTRMITLIVAAHDCTEQQTST